MRLDDAKGAAANGGIAPVDLARRIASLAWEAMRRHVVLLSNASQMAMGSGINAVLGFAFWWLAARAFVPATLGAQSALIAILSFVALCGEAGFGTLLLGEIQLLGKNASPLIVAATLAGTCGALLLSLPTVLLVAAYGWADPWGEVLVVAGCGLQGMALVLDQASMGLLRSELYLIRNAIFAVAKLALLIPAATGWHSPNGLLFAWVAGIGVSNAAICGYVWWRQIVTLARPQLRPLVRHIGAVFDHHMLNLASSAPILLLPVVVNACLGSAVNGAFSTGWMIFIVALMVPSSLTTVLFSTSGTESASLPGRVRFSLLVSLGFAGISTVVLGLFANPILALFNPLYPPLAGAAVRLFGLGLFGAAIKQHYLLIARHQKTMMRGALWLMAGAVAELGLAVAGGLLGTASWLTLGWLLGLAVVSIVLAIPVVRFCNGKPDPAGR